MPIVLIERDPFVSQETAVAGLRNQSNVRRPLYGIQVKEPKFAYISVFQDAGVAGGNLIPISLKDSSAPEGWSNTNHNFILTDVAESRQEKMQIIETFGDHYTFFYGEKPIVLQCAGMLVDTQDFNWKNEWWYNYNNFLRGTKAVEHRSRVFLGFDDVLVEGYIMNCSAQYSKDQPNLSPFSFSILLAKPPLDLTPAANPEVPEPGSTPWVSQAQDTRFPAGIKPNGDRVIVSYSAPEGRPEYLQPTSLDDRYSIDPITGKSLTNSQKVDSDAAIAAAAEAARSAAEEAAKRAADEAANAAAAEAATKTARRARQLASEEERRAKAYADYFEVVGADAAAMNQPPGVLVITPEEENFSGRGRGIGLAY